MMRTGEIGDQIIGGILSVRRENRCGCGDFRKGGKHGKFGTDHVLDIWKICIAKPSAKEALMLLQTSLLHVLEPCRIIPTYCPLSLPDFDHTRGTKGRASSVNCCVGHCG